MPKGFYKKTEEHKKKISKNLIGHYVSEETKRKISKAKKGKPSNRKPGKHNSMYGKHHSEETKRKIRQSEKKTKGGMTPDEESIRKSTKYKEWRQQVFVRDDFTCQKCGERGGRLQAHHIKPFNRLIGEVRQNLSLYSPYDGAMIYSPLWDVDNGKTLCKRCHNKEIIRRF